MHLVYYEWKKLWKNASVLKIVLFFIFLSGAVFWGELETDMEWIPEYLSIHKTVDIMTQNEAETWLKTQREEVGNIEYSGENYAREEALECIGSEIEALQNYGSYRASIQNQFKKNQEISIFSDSNVNQGSYMKKIADTYKQLSVNAPMKLQPYLGMERFYHFYVGDILSVILLLFLVSVVFIQERKNGKSDFAQTMPNGRGRIYAAKTAAVCGSMTGYIILTSGLNLIIENVIFGNLTFSAAAQSIPDLYSVPYAWTIGWYTVLFLFIKILGLFLLSAIAIWLARISGSEIITAAGLTMVTGLSAWMAAGGPGEGIQSVLRCWNIWSFLRGNSIIRSYELIRFGNITIEVKWGAFIFLMFAFIILFFAGITQEKVSRGERKKAEIKITYHGIFYYEMKKMWIYQRGLFLFLICILIQGSVVFSHSERIDTDEYFYQAYIDQFGDRITDQTDELLAREDSRLNEIEQQIEQEENVIKQDALARQLECRGGLEKYRDRVFDLRNEKKEKILLKDSQYDILFEFTQVSRMMVILLYVSLAFLVPMVFQKEKETRMEILQKTVDKGGKVLWDLKIVTILTYVLPMIVLFALFSFVRAAIQYRLDLMAPVNCLAEYWNFPFDCPVIVFFIFGILLQGILAAASIIVISGCAKRVKNQYVLTGILLGGTVIPTLISSWTAVPWPKAIHDWVFVFTSGWWLPVLIVIMVIVQAFMVLRKERCV